MIDRPSHPARPRTFGAGGDRAVGLAWLALLLATSMMAPPAVAQGMRPPPPLPTAPPFDLADPTVVEAGQHLFRQSCTGYCHGAEGRLSRAPALRGREFETRYLYQRIAYGFPPMPAFQTLLTQEDIWKLVAYIKSLQGAKE
jgi:mono/diheme cytochrome c family protein